MHSDLLKLVSERLCATMQLVRRTVQIAKQRANFLQLELLREPFHGRGEKVSALCDSQKLSGGPAYSQKLYFDA